MPEKGTRLRLHIVACCLLSFVSSLLSICLLFCQLFFFYLAVRLSDIDTTLMTFWFCLNHNLTITIRLPFLVSRHQAGRYDRAIDFAEKAKAVEEEQLGARCDKMADVFQLIATVKDEVVIFYNFNWNLSS